MRTFLAVLIISLGLTSHVFAHTAPLDEYGCHANKAMLGNANNRECHADLLAGQVFSSLTAELKAYISAQKVIIAQKDTTIAQRDTTIAQQQTTIVAREATIAAQQQAIAARDVTIATQQTTIASKDTTIADLNAKLSQCQANCPVVPPQPTVGSLTLTWNANGEADLAGYRAFCGTASHIYGPAVQLGKVTTVTIGNLPGGKTYFCSVKAFDTSNNASPFSQEVSKILP